MSDEFMKDMAGLGKAQKAVLREIGSSNEPIPISDERAVDKLYRKGLVHYSTNAKNQKIYSLTKTGQKVLSIIRR